MPLAPPSPADALSHLLGFVPDDIVPSSDSSALPESDFPSARRLDDIVDRLWTAVIEKNASVAAEVLACWPAKMPCPPRLIDGKSVRINEYGMRHFQEDVVSLLHARWPISAKTMVNAAVENDDVPALEWAIRARPARWSEVTGLSLPPPSAPDSVSGQAAPSGSTPWVSLSLASAAPHMFVWLLQRASTSDNKISGRVFTWFFAHVQELAQAQAAGSLSCLRVSLTPDSDPQQSTVTSNYFASHAANNVLRGACTLLAAAARSADPSDGAQKRWTDWMDSGLTNDTFRALPASTRPNIVRSVFEPLIATHYASPASLAHLARVAATAPRGLSFLKMLVGDLPLSTRGVFHVASVVPAQLGRPELLPQGSGAICSIPLKTALSPKGSALTLLDSAFFFQTDLVDALLRTAAGRRLVLDRMAQPDGFAFCCAFFDRPINKVLPLINEYRADFLSWRDDRGNNAAHWMVSVTLPKKPQRFLLVSGRGRIMGPTVSALIDLNRSIPGLLLESNASGVIPLSFVPGSVAAPVERSILGKTVRSVARAPNAESSSRHRRKI